MNTSVENYFIEGCGRCPLGGTADCKVHSWSEALDVLKHMILESGLKEECKWGIPCYTYNDKNVMTLSAFKDYCAISFFKGSLLNKLDYLLVKPGPNSQAARLIKFKDVKDIIAIENKIKQIIANAIEVEKVGLNVQFNRNPEPIPEELDWVFEEDPNVRNAFEALTPGRQRGYIIHFSQAKQAKTRLSRIEKCTPKILNGEGLHDKYQSRRKKKL